jgi:uncharacterized protein (DUF849 family)
MSTIFITAAPTGSMPRYLNPKEPKYISQSLIQTEPSFAAAIQQNKGWEKIQAGGLVISETTVIPLDSHLLKTSFSADSKIGLTQILDDTGLINDHDTLRYHSSCSPPSSTILGELLGKIATKSTLIKLVLHLTSQGWEGEDRNLVWKHGPVESFISPDIVQLLHDAGVICEFVAVGWVSVGPGYFQHSKGTTPYLPITPEAIIIEATAAAKEGASILHLHTRERGDMSTWEVPWTNLSIKLGCQTNKIVAEDYDIIIPHLRASAPLAVLNVSASVRGAGNVDSAVRRAHLKRYPPNSVAPEICTMSPAEVLFQSGGGYQNTPEFLKDQLESCEMNNIRPEIELFNRTILEKTLGSFKPQLLKVGVPPILMLVAGIDQHRRVEGSDALEDDSLIPVQDRKKIFSLIQAGKIEDALDLTTKILAPIVDEIREKLPEAKLSILFPGLMHVLLARVALKLSLDGVRIGLEDGLNVADPFVSLSLYSNVILLSIQLFFPSRLTGESHSFHSLPIFIRAATDLS